MWPPATARSARFWDQPSISIPAYNRPPKPFPNAKSHPFYRCTPSRLPSRRHRPLRFKALARSPSVGPPPAFFSPRLQRQPHPFNDITIRVGDAIEVADLLAQHEDKHGPLWKYSAAVTKGGADDEVGCSLFTVTSLWCNVSVFRSFCPLRWCNFVQERCFAGHSSC